MREYSVAAIIPEMSGEQSQLMPIFVKTSHLIVSAAFVINEKPSSEPTMACVPDTKLG